MRTKKKQDKKKKKKGQRQDKTIKEGGRMNERGIEMKQEK